MSGSVWAAATALWLGILTSISPCPLAANITAVSFIGRRAGSATKVLLAGFLYTIGRAAVYVVIGVVLVRGLLAAPSVSLALQVWVSKLLGPLLILVGMVMLDLLRFGGKGGAWSAWTQRLVERLGFGSALALGALFALSFCPVSAALYFGSLLPLAIEQNSGVALPLLYGIGTALPVIGVSFLLAFGVRCLTAAFTRVTRLERWLRWGTGGVFVLVGVYMTLDHIYGLF